MIKRVTLLFLLALAAAAWPAQNCSIYPNTLEQILGLGIVRQNVYELLPGGKKSLRWSYDFGPNGQCVKYVYRDNSGYSKKYYYNKYGRNRDGSYVCSEYGFYDKDSNEVMSSRDEYYYDFGAQRLGVRVYTMNSSGVITKSITLPVYNDKNSTVFQNFYRLDAQNDTLEKREMTISGKTETIVSAVKGGGKWTEKEKKIVERDSSGEILKQTTYKAGKFEESLHYTRKYSFGKVQEEIVKDQEGRMVYRIANTFNGNGEAVSSVREEYQKGLLSRKTEFHGDGETTYLYENGNLVNQYTEYYPVADPVPDLPDPLFNVDGSPIDQTVAPPPPPKTPLSIAQLYALKYLKDTATYAKPELKKVKPYTKEVFKDPVNKTGLLLREKYDEYGLIIYQEQPQNNVVYVYEYLYGK